MDRQKARELISAFEGKTILIVGDAMVDAYIWGRVERRSPEADVPVVLLDKKEEWLGGAANVALNIASAGGRPLLCAVVGDDKTGLQFNELMANSRLETTGILREKGRKTTVKTRVISDRRHVLRIDDEMTADISAETEHALLKMAKGFISGGEADAVLFQDYDKGVITKRVIADIVDAAHKQGIPIIVDPKNRNFHAYKNTTLFKPNLKELSTALGSVGEPGSAQFAEAVDGYRRKQGIEHLMVTLSEKGIFLCNAGGCEIYPAHEREVQDVSGAGDTVVAIASLCLAAGFDAALASRLSNLAGGLVCEKVGVSPIEKAGFTDAIAREL